MRVKIRPFASSCSYDLLKLSARGSAHQIPRHGITPDLAVGSSKALRSAHWLAVSHSQTARDFRLAGSTIRVFAQEPNRLQGDD
jgi:hypothetical protein